MVVHIGIALGVMRMIESKELVFNDKFDGSEKMKDIADRCDKKTSFLYFAQPGRHAAVAALRSPKPLPVVALRRQ